MFSFAMLKHNNDIPNDIPPELTASRYSTLMPIILVAFGQISVGTIASWQTSDLAFVIITLLSVVVTAARLLIIFAYRRRSRRGQSDAAAAACVVGLHPSHQRGCRRPLFARERRHQGDRAVERTSRRQRTLGRALISPSSRLKLKGSGQHRSLLAYPPH